MASQDEKNLQKCGPCSFDGETVEVNHFCVDCLEYLCTGCTREHRKHKASRAHKVLGDDELPINSSLFVQMKELSRCPTHPDIELDQKCQTHGVLICLKCLHSDHRMCADVVDITCRQDEDHTESKELIEELKRTYKAERTAMKKLAKAVQINNSEVEDEIRNFLHSMRANVENLDGTLTGRREHFISSLSQALSDFEQRLSSIEEKMIKYESLSAISLKYGSIKENVVLNLRMKSLLKDIKEDDTVKCMASKHVRFMVPVKTEDIVSLLSKCDVVLTNTQDDYSEFFSDEALSDDCQSTFSHTKTRDIGIQVDEALMRQQNSTTQNLVFMKIENKVSSIKFKDSTEGRSITALHVLSDGRILVLCRDKALKLYSLKLTLISTVDLQQETNDMCVLEETHDGVFTVALCFGMTHTITIFEYKDIFQEKYKLKCSSNVISLSMFVQHLAVLVQSTSLKSKHEIQLLDIKTGRVCYVFDEFEDSSNKSMERFSDPRRIHACKRRNQIILADTKTIFIIDIQDGECKTDTVYAVGPCLWKNRTFVGQSATMMDVTCDSQGNVYVLTYESALYQVFRSGGIYNVRELIPKRQNGSAVAIDERRRRIVVGYYISDRAHVFEYTLPIPSK